MGRTNPTYRDWLHRTEQEWQPFRRALRRRFQDDFDRLFERAAAHADAAGYLNTTHPELVLFLSVLLAQERELQELAARVDEIESPEQDPEKSEHRDHSGGGENGHQNRNDPDGFGRPDRPDSEEIEHPGVGPEETGQGTDGV